MSDDAILDLVVNAIGYGVMMALESRDDLIARIRGAGPTTTLADLLIPDAESFIHTRADLVRAAKGEQQ